MCELIQQLIYEGIIKVVVRARGAKGNHYCAIWRSLQCNDIFVNLPTSLWVHLQDVNVNYCHHRPIVKEKSSRDCRLHFGIHISEPWWWKYRRKQFAPQQMLYIPVVWSLQLSPAIVLQSSRAPGVIWIILILSRCWGSTYYIHLLSCKQGLITWGNFRFWLLDFLGLSDSPSVDLFHQSSTFSFSRVCGQSRPACGTSHWCHNPRRRGRTYRSGQNPTFPRCNLWKPVKYISALVVLDEDLVLASLRCETH